MLKLASVALLIAVGSPAVAQTAAPQAQPAPQGAKAPDPLDKIVCRTEEVIGSRLNSQRVCLTVREWRQQAEDSREAVERIQQGQGTVPSG